ncbi:MAG: 30S ribosomal protein S13 [Candidatus Altiarchaeota archaeon]
MMEEEKGKKKKKPEKKEVKDHRPKPPEAVAGVDKDFVHLVRLAGVVVNGSLTIPKALMKVRGIGPRVAETIIIHLGFPADTKVGSLKEPQIAEIEKKLEGLNTMLPTWMLNRRKDFVTGVDFHKIGPELDIQRREDINREKKIRSYRGIRHSLDLPVRGQRTRSSFRTGSTIGVSRKKAAASVSAKPEKGKQ